MKTTKSTTLIASPGILIAEELQDTHINTIKLTGENNSRLIKAKVISVGKDIKSSLRPIITKDYAIVGNTVYFLSYEGNYDNTIIDNKKYYFVKLEDLRSVVK